MKQYEKSGTTPIKRESDQDHNLKRLVEDLEQRVAMQSKIIEGLERDLRKLRNDMRMAIATANSINYNNNRNG